MPDALRLLRIRSVACKRIVLRSAPCRTVSEISPSGSLRSHNFLYKVSSVATLWPSTARTRSPGSSPARSAGLSLLTRMILTRPSCSTDEMPIQGQ